MGILKRIVILMFCIVSLGMCVTAHPGDTDSAGGHYDSSTGEYHYHHGYPAHQHYDIDGDGKADCPYDFDDKTGHNSGGSSSSEKSFDERYQEWKAKRAKQSPQRGWVNPQAVSNQTKQDETEKSGGIPVTPKNMKKGEHVMWWVCVAAGAAILYVFLWMAYRNEKKQKYEVIRENKACIAQQQREYESKCSQLNKQIEAMKRTYDIRICELEKQISNERQKNKKIVRDYMGNKNSILKVMYGDRYLYLLSGASSDDDLDSDMLPTQLGTKKDWGERYTFYYTPQKRNGKYTVHTAECRFCNREHPINAYTIQKNKKEYRLCESCCPELPNVEWVDRYQYNKEFLDQYLNEDIK